LESIKITVIRAIKATAYVQKGRGSTVWCSLAILGDFGFLGRFFGLFGDGAAEYPHIGQPFLNILSLPE